jgi:hypothetical protein
MESERIEVKTRRKITVNKTKRNDINGTLRQRRCMGCNTSLLPYSACVVNTLQIFLSTHRGNTREAEEK